MTIANDQGPPQAERVPQAIDTPTDHSNFSINSIRTPVKAYRGRWPVDFALWWASTAPVIPQEHGKNIPHRLILGSGWSPKAGTVGSQDPEIIKDWWAQDPAANIGIVTAVSPLSHVLVIDIDTKPGKPNGWESIFHLMEEYGPLQETMSVITPSGGTHLYYAMPEGEPPVPGRVGWLPGVDIPWQVPVPPSAKLKAGIYVEYEWVPIVGPLPVAPAWLLADIRNRGRRSQRSIRRAETCNRPRQPQRPIRAGGAHGHSSAHLPSTDWFLENGFRLARRNQDCHRLACRLVRNHWPNVDLVHSIMYGVWLKTEQLGHTFAWSEAMACISSALRYVGPRVEEEIAWMRDLRWTPWL
jgi:hypothetical protein